MRCNQNGILNRVMKLDGVNFAVKSVTLSWNKPRAARGSRDRELIFRFEAIYSISDWRRAEWIALPRVESGRPS